MLETADDRDAVGQCLRLVEVMRGQQDRLAEVRRERIVTQALRRAAGSKPVVGLIEEDQLGIADQRERQIEAPELRASAFSLPERPVSEITSSTPRGWGYIPAKCFKASRTRMCR